MGAELPSVLSWVLVLVKLGGTVALPVSRQGTTAPRKRAIKGGAAAGIVIGKLGP